MAYLCLSLKLFATGSLLLLMRLLTPDPVTSMYLTLYTAPTVCILPGAIDTRICLD